MSFDPVANRGFGQVVRSDAAATLADVEHPFEFHHQIVCRWQPGRVGSASAEQPHKVRAPYQEPTGEVVLAY